MAEIHFGQKADLVIVVEHHPTMAGDTEVLQQHVARKDIRRRQLFDRQPVIFQHLAHLLVAGMLKVEIQGRHAALGPAVAHQHGIALHLDR